MIMDPVMPVGQALGATETQPENKVETGDQNELGRDAFLKLLVTQLEYQSPMEPMKNEDFVAQLAQFSVVEQLTAVRESMEQVVTELTDDMDLFGQGLALLGRDVKLTTIEGGEFEGTVQSVRQVEEGAALVIDENTLPLVNIEEVELI
jgi:flagellar basal-body rod modification protein FlgD